MACWDIGMRNIVDVDGQLLAIDVDLIDTKSLLSRANLPVERRLWLVRAGERFALRPNECVRLSQDEVFFFESSEVAASNLRLAA